MSMKLTAQVMIGAILLTSTAQAASFLDRVQSISCKDLKPSQKASVKLETSGPGADKYVRLPGKIPYAFGNQKNEMGVFQSGTFSLGNDPLADGGMISLVDQGSSTLLLFPTTKADSYTGVLTGGIDIDSDWVQIKNHPVHCKVSFERE